jgi:hypothetical protein
MLKTKTAKLRVAREVRRQWIRAGRDLIDRDEWATTFARVDPQQLMTAREQKKFEALPESFTVYRGYVKGYGFDNADGLSWTLDRNVAEFFASEMVAGVVSTVVERVVNKQDVFAYIEKNGNNEKEIIILPKQTRKRGARWAGGKEIGQNSR